MELLEKDNKIFPPSLLTNLIQMIMPYDLIRAIEAATDIGDVLAVSGNFNIFLPIARLLLFPTIYESDMIYGILLLPLSLPLPSPFLYYPRSTAHASCRSRHGRKARRENQKHPSRRETAGGKTAQQKRRLRAADFHEVCTVF